MSSPDGSTVTFRRTSVNVSPRAIARFAQKLQKEVAKGRAFDTLITGDADLRRWNREFRGNDYATDVLSFPSPQRSLTVAVQWPVGARSSLNRDREGASRLGDLAISLPRARAQAREFGHSAEEEIRILMLHGLLHLLGMDHESDGGRMARVEKRWRLKLGLPNGLIERVAS